MGAAEYSRRYREDGMPSRQEIPAVSDPRWEAWCAPLLVFIAEKPRSWEELEAWEKERHLRPSLLTNMICWLEIHHRIVAVESGGPLVWVAVRRDR